MGEFVEMDTVERHPGDRPLMAVVAFGCAPATGCYVPADRPGVYALTFQTAVPGTNPPVVLELPTLLLDLQSVAHTIAAIEDTAAYMGQSDALRAQLEGARVEQANLNANTRDRNTRCAGCGLPAEWERGAPKGRHAAGCPSLLQ
jgi:hypothetical protein